MHILHIHDRLSTAGGADIHLLAVAAEQAAEHRVSLATGRADDTALLPPGVAHHSVAGLGGRRREAAAATRRLEALIAALRPDLLHLHNVLQPRVMRAVAASGRSVVTVQDHRSFCPGRGRLLPSGAPCSLQPGPEACAGCFDSPAYASMITALTRERAAALRGFGRVIVLSHYMAGELTRAGVAAERIRVIPPFPWRPPGAEFPAEDLPRPPYALAAGRLVEAKGFAVLLEAWRRARPALPLLIAGDGPARAALEARSTELDVRFLGWQPLPRVHALLAGAQVAVMPSLWAEPFGIFGLEAQALGVPVVASDVGGVRDWLRPEHGWLVPPGDPEALADALREASDPTRAGERGARARRFSQRFAPAELMDRLRRCYDDLLTPEPPRPGPPPTPPELP